MTFVFWCQIHHTYYRRSRQTLHFSECFAERTPYTPHTPKRQSDIQRRYRNRFDTKGILIWTKSWQKWSKWGKNSHKWTKMDFDLKPTTFRFFCLSSTSVEVEGSSFVSETGWSSFVSNFTGSTSISQHTEKVKMLFFWFSTMFRPLSKIGTIKKVRQCLNSAAKIDLTSRSKISSWFVLEIWKIYALKWPQFQRGITVPF